MVNFLLGEKFRLPIEGAVDEAVVSLPKNHNAQKSWPAVFYYHGTNGEPSTSLIRSHAGNEDWIVVGMPYAQRGTFQLTPEGMEAELAIFRQVKTALEERANLDPSRVFISGLSKGGWFSGLLMQKEPSLAGAAILLAGHMSQLETNIKALREGTPVFLGVGRLDLNYPFSLRARVFFRKLGAQVDMETWQGLEHAFPKEGSPGLKDWFAIQNGKKGDGEELRTELDEILSEADEFQRWWSLLEFAQRPFVKADKELLSDVQTKRAELEETPMIAREARILKESRRLLAREIGKKTLPELEEIVKGYARIAKAAKGTPQGEVAIVDEKRVAEILVVARKQYGDQKVPEQNTTIRPPTKAPRIYNPLLR